MPAPTSVKSHLRVHPDDLDEAAEALRRVAADIRHQSEDFERTAATVVAEMGRRDGGIAALSRHAARALVAFGEEFETAGQGFAAIARYYRALDAGLMHAAR